MSPDYPYCVSFALPDRSSK